MKPKVSFVCQQCGYESPSWMGKCPQCGEWNTLVETAREVPRSKSQIPNKFQISNSKPQKLSEVRHIEKNRLKSGYGEFDRVVGGGIVPGSATLLAGDPGIGKSTLVLHVLSRIGGLYVSGEESAEQVKLRAKRLGIDGGNITVFAETNAEGIADAIRNASRPHPPGRGGEGEVSCVIVDSIQTLSSGDLEGMAGSVGQIRYCAQLLISAAKPRGIPLLIIGHVTKEGAIAGPKILEHMVDTVLYLEGERFGSARILRTLKNRFGAVEEVGIFEMGEKGLIEVTNPSALFLQDRVTNVPGSVITVVMEGTRPMLVEIQALVVPTNLAIPRRVGSGIDHNRLQLIVAILQKRLNLALGTFDIFVNVSGGIRVGEPAADLAVALAILSSFHNTPVDHKTAVFGELGLLGEVRTTRAQERRSSEAKRLGFATIISPQTARSLKDAAEAVG